MGRSSPFSLISRVRCNAWLSVLTDDATPQIKGEPWVKPMVLPEADGQQAVLQPVTVEFNLEKIQKIMAMEETSRHDLLKLLE